LELRSFVVKRYKGYREETELKLAPLTILVGANNSGKTALAQGIQLFAGGISSSAREPKEPLPLTSGDICHGLRFRDLVADQSQRGLCLSANFADQRGDLSLSATVGEANPDNRFAERQVWHWSMTGGDHSLGLETQGIDKEAVYKVAVSGKEQDVRRIAWRGLIPAEINELSESAFSRVDALLAWAGGIRHLQCPRDLLPSPFRPTASAPSHLGVGGQNAPLILAADDALRKNIRKWYRKAFDVNLDISTEGSGLYSDLTVQVKGGDSSVRLSQSGRGLSHVLPFAVMALTAGRSGPGVDIVEHPEAELHPAAQTEVAELMLENLAGCERPMVVETHSEMILLRARRWIAEKRISPEDLQVYWIERTSDRGSVAREISIDEEGEVGNWPQGVFVEDYEEIMAILRATRKPGND